MLQGHYWGRRKARLCGVRARAPNLVRLFLAASFVRLALGQTREKTLENELYLLIQGPMFMLGKIGKPIFQTLPNSEQQSSTTLWHSLTVPVYR
jgi:hypothetical protein